MCGLTGFVVTDAAGFTASRAVAEQMAATLTHRGPDDAGVWVDEAAGVALAHRRLAILDLTPAGHQPMVSASGRYVIVFNGEIYNHLDLRRELEGKWPSPLAPLPEGEGDNPPPPTPHPSPNGRGEAAHISIPSPARGRGDRGEGGLPSALRDFARKLRREATDAERLIWYLLRDRRLAGRKFRRQHPVPPYILDFYCPELKLAIELDGGQHADTQSRDAERDRYLAGKGIRLLRFWDHEVLTQTEAVLERIWAEVAPSPQILQSISMTAHSALTPDPCSIGRGELTITPSSSSREKGGMSASPDPFPEGSGEMPSPLSLSQGERGLCPSPPLPGGEGSGQGGARRTWRGHSDTETLLAAFEAWGIEKTLHKVVGMFALALWDRETRTLTLARDRMGEKPLYYGWVKGALVFASELKAIRAFPGFDNAIERRALALFMRYCYIPAPWSIYQNIWKLPPGCYVQFGEDALTPSPSPGGRGEIKVYWSLRQVAEAGLAQPFAGSEEEAVEELERLIRQSLAGQMIADVPLGAFLSGGIDSSTVVALMQAQSSRPVKTFSIGFHEGEYDEAQHAKAVARHLGTEHTEWYLTPQDALDVIPKLPALYDEPFADSSQIPTHLVCALARRHVTVALSGDGGDELFGGYNRYFWAMALWRRLASLPMPLRRMTASGIRVLSPGAWNQLYRAIEPAVPRRLRLRLPGDKLHKAAGLLGARRPEEIYRALVSHWDQPASLVLGATEPATSVTDPAAWLETHEFPRQMMYLDAITYLPDDILVKVDRAAMGVSLETRVPLLDHRIVEFAWRVPLHMKIREGQGKWLLRQVLYRYVPKELIERPKMGFGVPIDHWLRGPLKDWAEALLAEERLKREGFLDPAPIRRRWQEHLSGQRNWQYHLWNVLMWQAWLEQQRAT